MLNSAMIQTVTWLSDNFCRKKYGSKRSGTISSIWLTPGCSSADQYMWVGLRMTWTWTLNNTGHHNPAPSPTMNWLNFKFYYDMFAYIFSLICLITMDLCTYQDSTAVLVCAKFHCDQISLLWTEVMRLLMEFGIYIKYGQCDGSLVRDAGQS